MAASICLEGIEYNGKSSLTQLAARTITDTTSFPVTFFREPGGTVIGEHIRNTLKTDQFKGMHPVTSLLLFSASRNELLEARVFPWKKENPDGITIGDRCWLSSLAYQTAEGAPVSYIRNIQQPFMGYPDLIALVDILPIESLVRRKAEDGSMRDEDWRDKQSLEEQAKVRGNYLTLYKEFRNQMVIIDGFSDFWEMVLAVRNLALGQIGLDPVYTEAAKKAIEDFTPTDLHDYMKTKHIHGYKGFFERAARQEEVRRELGIEDRCVLRRRMLEEWDQLEIQGMSFSNWKA